MRMWSLNHSRGTDFYLCSFSLSHDKIKSPVKKFAETRRDQITVGQSTTDTMRHHTVWCKDNDSSSTLFEMEAKKDLDSTTSETHDAPK
ncbi:hypothetical protein MW887_002515 [Aspergillus wentii]|nr:hypothetical protein MW887_002515 [Aspergillus wentii]